MFDSFFGMPLLGHKYDFKDKRRCIDTYMRYMYIRTMSMFEYENLPDTIPKRYLELYLQNNGHAAIVQVDGDLYATFGNWGGKPDAYYVPTEYVVANPYLNVFKTYTIGEDCVIVGNDSLYRGLQPMYTRYASLLVENDLSFLLADVNARIVSIINANDENTRASAVQYLQDVERGELGVIRSNGFLDDLSFTTQPFSSRNTSGALTDLIEYHQYLKASWFNELGLNANYNMKREAINSGESQLNDDMLLPLIDDMLACRQRGLDEVNAMFGTDIRVRFGSSWEDNALELELEQDAMAEARGEEPMDEAPGPGDETTDQEQDPADEEPQDEAPEPTDETTDQEQEPVGVDVDVSVSVDVGGGEDDEEPEGDDGGGVPGDDLR